MHKGVGVCLYGGGAHGAIKCARMHADRCLRSKVARRIVLQK
jgi:hypothetical protein